MRYGVATSSGRGHVDDLPGIASGPGKEARARNHVVAWRLIQHTGPTRSALDHRQHLIAMQTPVDQLAVAIQRMEIEFLQSQ